MPATSGTTSAPGLLPSKPRTGAGPGNPDAEAIVWDSLGYIRLHLGQPADSITCYEHAVSLLREVGNRVELAATLISLGDACLADCRAAAAQDVWQQALAILDDLHHPDAALVRARLESLDSDTAGNGHRELAWPQLRVRGRAAS